MKLSELASLTAARIEGNPNDVDIELTGAAGLDDAGPAEVTFLANPRYTPKVSSTQASAIYLSEDARIDRELPVLRAKDPVSGLHARA